MKVTIMRTCLMPLNGTLKMGVKTVNFTFRVLDHNKQVNGKKIILIGHGTPCRHWCLHCVTPLLVTDEDAELRRGFGTRRSRGSVLDAGRQHCDLTPGRLSTELITTTAISMTSPGAHIGIWEGGDPPA